MEKKLIVKFVKEKRKGVYNAIVDVYANVLFGSFSVTLLKNLIELDLERFTGERITLNYDSLVKAIRRQSSGKSRPQLHKTFQSPAAGKYDFKDSHESNETKSTKPGGFKI